MSTTSNVLIPLDKRPIVVTGPSGSGKSTLIQKLFASHPTTFGFSVSHTTRRPRPGEEDGIAYYFVDRSTMEKMIQDKQFIEHAEFAGNLYGTSVQAVQDVEDHGKICILDIELNGVRQVKESPQLHPRFVLIQPKDLTVLEDRLRGRATESESDLQKRLQAARVDWEAAHQPGLFDKIVINDRLEDAYRDLHQYIFGDPE
ncbi:guanylate kinase [Actinomortierella ambigua]|uniref:Guanylate kinase n=1 Tax=Actinomortierella ambigua TaxID=1343610 RepID=A0A9P6Q8Z4_9FUNG|nr:guanylate kinase [Actinomortierella ambigua]